MYKIKGSNIKLPSLLFFMLLSGFLAFLVVSSWFNNTEHFWPLELIITFLFCVTTYSFLYRKMTFITEEGIVVKRWLTGKVYWEVSFDQLRSIDIGYLKSLSSLLRVTLKNGQTKKVVIAGFPAPDKYDLVKAFEKLGQKHLLTKDSFYGM